MAWTIDYSKSARNQLKKLDKPVARRILDFLDNRVAKHDDPRTLGKALTGSLGTLWRYRVGDYRIICEIQTLNGENSGGARRPPRRSVSLIAHAHS